MPYVAGILSTTTVWAPGTAPLWRRSVDRVAAGRRRSCAANRMKFRYSPGFQILSKFTA
jgi:hypothetical protein